MEFRSRPPFVIHRGIDHGFENNLAQPVEPVQLGIDGDPGLNGP